MLDFIPAFGAFIPAVLGFMGIIILVISPWSIINKIRERDTVKFGQSVAVFLVGLALFLGWLWSGI